MATIPVALATTVLASGQDREEEGRESSRHRGAGFIGSTIAELLLDLGHDVVALERLMRIRRDNVLTRVAFVEVECGDAAPIRSLGVFDVRASDAARFELADSMAQPEVFFAHNVAQCFAMFEALIVTGTTRVVFSYSCVVYGT